MKRFILLLLASISTLASFSQWELGADYSKPIGKGYKSNIAGVHYENFSNKIGFSVGLTYHFAPRDAYGGFKGYGLFAGIRNYFGNNAKGNNPFVGLKLSFALENFEGKTSLGSLMFTPSAEAGYHFVFGKHIFTTPSIGYGYQIKITKEYNSRNDDVGGRLIPGLSAGYRF